MRKLIRTFVREDLIEVACMLGAFTAANVLVELYVARDDKQAIGFIAGFLAALAGILIGKWLQRQADRRRKVGDD